MSSRDSHTPGARGSQEADDLDLQATVTGLMKLAVNGMSDLNSYNASTCDKKIQEVVTCHMSLISQMLSQVTLLYQRKAQLQAAEYMEQITVLQTSYHAEQHKNLILQQEVKDLRDQLSEVKEENETIQQDCPYLNLQLQTTEDQMKAVLIPDPSDIGSDPDAAPVPEEMVKTRTADTMEDKLRAERQASRARIATTCQELEGARQTVRVTPADLRTVSGEVAAPTEMPDMIILDQYTPPLVHHRHGNASCTRSATSSALQRSIPDFAKGRTSLEKGGHQPYSLRDDRDFGPTPADMPYLGRRSRPHLDQTSSPQRRRSHGLSHQDSRNPESSDDSDDASTYYQQGLRIRQLESLARDIESFDPRNQESSIDDYLREVDRCLLDLPHASAREKLRLIWKTTSRSVRVFMETLPPKTRDHYSALCQALREEYSHYTDHASATLDAFAVTQKKLEPPWEYYRRLRAAYFQGRNTPGLEEEHAFKSLFLHNLHESVRYDVTMHCRTNNLNMQEMRRYAQLAWETRVRPSRTTDSVRVLEIQPSATAEVALEGGKMPRAQMQAGPGPPAYQSLRPQGGHPSQRTNSPNWSLNLRPPPQDTCQPDRKVRFKPNSKQGRRYGGKAPLPFRGEDFQEESLKELIRKCVAETFRSTTQAA